MSYITRTPRRRRPLGAVSDAVMASPTTSVMRADVSPTVIAKPVALSPMVATALKTDALMVTTPKTTTNQESFLPAPKPITVTATPIYQAVDSALAPSSTYSERFRSPSGTTIQATDKIAMTSMTTQSLSPTTAPSVTSSGFAPLPIIPSTMPAPGPSPLVRYDRHDPYASYGGAGITKSLSVKGGSSVKEAFPVAKESDWDVQILPGKKVPWWMILVGGYIAYKKFGG